MAGITLRNLQKTFTDPATRKQVHAVDNLNLEIRDGEFLVLVGPSGCGKSTTMRMIAGLEDPTGGEIAVGDRVVNNVAPRDRNMAMVFQSYALYPHMTVYDNMAFGLRLRRLPSFFQQMMKPAETRELKAGIDRDVRKTAEMLGLSKQLDRRPKALSGGQRQRVALGRAIVREPEVFLMDEPLSNLDAQLRVQTRADLIKLHRRLGITTVYVTHDQVEAMTMGQRIVVMKDGLLQQCDTPLTLYHKPANMFVAGFLGTPSMNFISQAHVRKGASGMWGVETEAGTIVLADERQSALQAAGERDVVVGIRPQGIYPKASAPPHVVAQGNAMRAKIEVIEPMGAISTLYLQAGSQSLVAEVDADAVVHEGDTLDLLIDTSTVHLFDPTTEKVIA